MTPTCFPGKSLQASPHLQPQEFFKSPKVPGLTPVLLQQMVDGQTPPPKLGKRPTRERFESLSEGDMDSPERQTYRTPQMVQRKSSFKGLTINW